MNEGREYMKVLLDTNIWRYIADADAIDVLIDVVSSSTVELVIVPALIFEVSNFKDINLRKKILRMMANPAWTRLMPETFLEASEIKQMIRKYRPEWLIKNPDLSELNQIKMDWESPDNGFWNRAANDIELPATDESIRGEQEHELARIESREIRNRVFKAKKTLPASFNLQGAYGIPPPDAPGCREEPVEYWRIPSLCLIQAELNIYTSPYREWLDSEIDVLKIKDAPKSVTELLYYEVSPQDLPRQWMRGTFEFLQAFHKVTAGTPADAQLSSHLVDVDVVMSADKNFIRFAIKCKEDAPFHTAQPYLVEGGENAIDHVKARLESLRNDID
jgi:hypothetical protein